MRQPPCPYCGERFEDRGLDGHLRLAHGGEPRLEELLRRLRLRNRAARCRRALGEIDPVSELHANVLSKCDRLARETGGELENMLDEIRSQG